MVLLEVLTIFGDFVSFSRRAAILNIVKEKALGTRLRKSREFTESPSSSRLIYEDRRRLCSQGNNHQDVFFLCKVLTE